MGRVSRVVLLAVGLARLLAPDAAVCAPWMEADWGDDEPSFPAGSLFWKTRQYPTSPVLFRTVLEVEDKPVGALRLAARASGFAYVFLNGKQIAAHVPEGEPAVTESFAVVATEGLKRGRNVLIVSTKPEGFSLEGAVYYQRGRPDRFGTDTRAWKVQKLPPLTMLEYEPCMQPDFDDSDWFSVTDAKRPDVEVSEQTLRDLCMHVAAEHTRRLDEDAKWRLQMLADKGIAIVDWEAHGWGGAERLPEWVRVLAALPVQEWMEPPAPGWYHAHAENLTRYIVLADEATNMANLPKGLAVLGAPGRDVNACREAAQTMRAALSEAQKPIHDHAYLHSLAGQRARAALEQAQAASEAAREDRLLNRLNQCLDNKFSWFDTTALLDNDITGWGLRLETPAEVFASPLSPAALVTVEGNEFALAGWEELAPLRTYKKPPVLGPVCLWAVLDGKVMSLKPGDGGVVYDRPAHGALSENWVLLVENMESGGRLPVELVFLKAPTKIAFAAGEKGTARVTVTFQESDARLFVLRPLKEWRGFLGTARVMNQHPLNEAAAQRYVESCRLWSRALLNYPVTFSEAFARDPKDKWALLVADVYNYQELEDEWGTEPLRLAPLPPLASYGLMTDYPGLKVISDAEVLGSRGIWGDEIAAVGQDHIVYRVPLDPIKRFGGFTSYCFSGADIGVPGNIKEIESIVRAGANTYRPQHNQNGEAAMRVVDWCWEQGLQNVFNTDEKWVLDVVEHFRKLAEQCKDYPPDAVAYDLLNEPETRDPRAYNALIRKVTAAIREVDNSHLIYAEVIPPWGPGAKPYPRGAFESLEPTGDRLTCYSFHDYEFRLPPRWPNEEHDVRNILARWIPALRFAIDHRCPIHLGEFGGFEQTKQSVYDNACALTLMMDYLRIFDQFGWHWHYYANRGVVRVRKDGSLQESYVQDSYRRYFATGRFNANRTPTN